MNRLHVVSRHSLGLAGVVVLSVVLGGCGESGPKTHPVKGRVVLTGKQVSAERLRGGKVWLQSTADPKIMAMAVIDEDGSFSMNAYLPEEKKGYSGVLPGQYNARVEPPRDEDTGKPARGLFQPKYEIFDKSGLTFTVPTSGETVLELEAAGR